jgi:hypothetical protein
MAESYLYKPSESINEKFGQAAAGIGNIFSHIIKKKQEDYALAENTFENINDLTAKLGQYGQSEITNSTKQLLDKAASTIQKNGKLDYDALGAIRNGITDIKNRKSAIEGATEAYKQKVQIALATKDDLTNLSSTLLDLEKPLLNTKNKSAQDIISQMDKAYENNIDTNVVTTKLFSKLAPITDFETDYEAADGSKRRVAGKVISGSVYDPITKTFKDPAPIDVVQPDGTVKQKDYYDVLTEKIATQSPSTLAMLKNRAGVANSFLSDKDIVKEYYNQYKALQVAPKDVEVKSKSAIDLENLSVADKQFENSIQGEKWYWQKQQYKASIAASNATRAAALAKTQAMSPNGKIDPAQYGIVADENPNSKYYGSKSIDFGAKVEMTIPKGEGKGATGMRPFQVQGVRTLPNGKKQIYGYAVKTGMVDAMGNKIYGTQTQYIDVDKNVEANLNMAIKNLGKDKQENLEAGLYLYDNLQPNVDFSKVKGTTQNKQTWANAIAPKLGAVATEPSTSGGAYAPPSGWK